MRGMFELVLPLFFVGLVSAQSWSEFSPPTDCIVPRGCGKGFSLSVRSCIGGPCTTGENVLQSDCTVPCLPLPSWSDWVESSCDKRCGDGSIKRVRQCVNGLPGEVGCPGIDVEDVSCVLRPCPERYTDCYEPSVSHSYIGTIERAGGKRCKMWSAGKSTFKPGNHPAANLAGRLCRSPGTPMGPPFCQTTSSFVATDCGIPVCNPNASWSDYTWSTCSQSCGGGTRTGVRECIDGDVGQGTCIGPVSTTEMCNTEDCPPPEDACFSGSGPVMPPP